MKKKRIPSREEIQAIADADHRVKAIKESGIAVATFYRLCAQYEIDYRRESSSYKLTPHDDELIQMLLERGISARAIAKKFGVCHTSILKRQERASRNIPPKQAEV